MATTDLIAGVIGLGLFFCFGIVTGVWYARAERQIDDLIRFHTQESEVYPSPTREGW